MINSRMLFAAGVFLFGLMQGCTMVQTYPLAARAGDTITIAPGSLDGATKTNLTVQYYSDSNPTVPINLSSNIRSVFNITPDRTSPAWLSSSAFGIPMNAGHSPWQTVIALNLPQQGIPEGNGHLRVTLGSGVTAPPITHKPDGVDIALRILPGSGISNPFSYLGMWFETVAKTGNLNDLMPGKQYVIKANPGAVGAAVSYAAAQYTLHMPLRNTSDGLPPLSDDVHDSLVVILDSHPNFDRDQVVMQWRQDGDNIIISVICANGRAVDYQTRISLVLDPASSFDFYSTPSISNITYFDVNGNAIPFSLMPILQGINI